MARVQYIHSRTLCHVKKRVSIPVLVSLSQISLLLSVSYQKKTPYNKPITKLEVQQVRAFFLKSNKINHWDFSRNRTKSKSINEFSDKCQTCTFYEIPSEKPS